MFALIVLQGDIIQQTGQSQPLLVLFAILVLFQSMAVLSVFPAIKITYSLVCVQKPPKGERVMKKFTTALVGSMGVGLAFISPLAYVVTSEGLIAAENPFRYLVGWTLIFLYSLITGMCLLYQATAEE